MLAAELKSCTNFNIFKNKLKSTLTSNCFYNQKNSVMENSSKLFSLDEIKKNNRYTSLLSPSVGLNKFLDIYIYIELPKYYARLQTVVARGFGFPVGRLPAPHIDATLEHSLCYFSSVSEQMVTNIDVHLQSGDFSVY